MCESDVILFWLREFGWGFDDCASLIVVLVAQFWCVYFGCVSLTKVWWWFWVARVWWGVCLRNFEWGLWLCEFGVCVCVWVCFYKFGVKVFRLNEFDGGFACESLVVGFGCASLVGGLLAKVWWWVLVVSVW